MPCCGGGADDDDGAPVAAGGADGGEGPLVSDVDRSCRDVLWLCLAVAFAAGGLAIGALGFRNGRLEALVYGVDYSGQVCRTGALKPYGVRYWLNPNEVLAADTYSFNLADAAAICLETCPPLRPAGNVTWVCKYPVDPDGTLNAPAAPAGPSTLAAWSATGHDYFAALSPAAKATSCALAGPCYPVLWATSEEWATCQPETLTNLPLSPGLVAAFKTCVSCCGATPPRRPECSPPAFDFAPRNASRTVYNPAVDAQYVACLARCEAAHNSIAELAAASSGQVDPTAVAQFRDVCAAAGATAVPVPLPAPANRTATAVSAALTNLLTAQQAVAQRYVADVAHGWRTILVCGLILPAALSLAWLALLRYAAAALVWTTVLGADAAALAGTLYCFVKAGRIGDSAITGVSEALLSRVGANATTSALAPRPDASSADRAHMYAAGIAAAIATALLWTATAVMLPRLRLATATLRVAVATLGAAPAVALAPIASFAVTCLFLVWWVAAAIFMYASGTITRRNCCAEVQAAWADAFTGVDPALIPPSLAAPTCADIHCGFELAPDWRLRGALVYHIWELFWGTHFLHAFTLLVVADVTFECYIARGTGAALPAAPTWHAARTAAAFYLGSLALGSFLSAFAQLWALPIALLLHHLSRAHRIRGGDGHAAQARLRGPAQPGDPPANVGLVPWLLRTLRALRARVGMDPWALLTVEGRPYCASAQAAHALLAANAATVAPVHAVSAVLCFVGRVGVAAGCAFWAFVYLDVNPPSQGISSPLLPVILVAVLALLVSGMFVGVVEMSIETTLVAFCDDCAAHGGAAACSPPELVAALEGLKEGPCWGLRQRVPRCCGGLPPADAEKGAAAAQIPKTAVA